MSNTPKVRFAGYTKEWEKHELSEVFDYLQNNTLSRAELSLENGVARNVHYGDVLVRFPEFLDVSKSTLPFIESEQTAEKFKDSFLQDGDVVMADTAEDATVGKCSEVAGVDGFPTISGLHTIPMRPKEKYAPGYLGYYMNSDAYHKQLIPLMQGIKVSSVSKSAIKKTDIVFPSEHVEQAAVGKLFIKLENLISFYQDEYNKLASMKSACLDKMFPKNGSKVPELRFSGFKADWERCALSRYVDVYDGVHQTPAYQIEGVMFLSVENIETLRSEKYISIEDFERDYKVYPEKGDILMTRIGDVGTPNVVETNEKIAYYVSLALLKPHGIDSYFLNYAIQSSEFRRELRKRTLTSAIPMKINKDEIGKLPISVPKETSEQKKLGENLWYIDQLISLYIKRIIKLNQIKEALQHNMFV